MVFGWLKKLRRRKRKSVAFVDPIYTSNSSTDGLIEDFSSIASGSNQQVSEISGKVNVAPPHGERRDSFERKRKESFPRYIQVKPAPGSSTVSSVQGPSLRPTPFNVVMENVSSKIAVNKAQVMITDNQTNHETTLRYLEKEIRHGDE